MDSDSCSEHHLLHAEYLLGPVCVHSSHSGHRLDYRRVGRGGQTLHLSPLSGTPLLSPDSAVFLTAMSGQVNDHGGHSNLWRQKLKTTEFTTLFQMCGA